MPTTDKGVGGPDARRLESITVVDAASAHDRYQLGAVLGRGGMGVVYKAYDTQLKREVALKTLLDVDNAAALDLFYKEWGLLATIVHPNIVGIYDVGEFELDGAKRPFFVMPLLQGVTLEQLIRERSMRLTVETGVAIITQACRGLQAAHELGLIHRDLKPSNIFVLDDNSVKLIDFGIARLARTASGAMLKGTLFYMAPEVLQMKPPTVLSDLFSLAVVCYETLGGRRPFRGASDSDVISAVMNHNPPALSEINAGVNYSVSQVVHKALAKQPWHRFPTAREFGEALQKAMRNEPLEWFNPAEIQPRIRRAEKTFEQKDYDFAAELLAELEGEGHLDPRITVLRGKLNQAIRTTRSARLLEAARRFYEAQEHPLALRKVQEILEADPENPEALALREQIETARSARRIGEWTKLARQSLERGEFRQAREALENLRKLRPQDPEVDRLAAEIEHEEQELIRTRQQRAHLYKLAMESWERGDISAACKNLETLMSVGRGRPDPASTSGMYQKFYDQVRLEKEALHKAYDEARQRLAAGACDAALAICHQYLARFPNHALFHALKCDVEQRKRREESAYVVEINRRVEEEPDLARQVAMLEDALRKRPGLADLERALALAREKRELVRSLASRARELEVNGRYADALEQWDTLRTIHPAHPGLLLERERVVQAAARQTRLEARARRLEEIEGYRRAGAREKALQAAEQARAEFPDDPDVREVERSLREELAAPVPPPPPAGAPAGAAPPQAAQTQSGRVVTSVLIGALLEQAGRVLEADPEAAESLVERVLALEPDHERARDLRRVISKRRREEYLNWCVDQARRLEASGNRAGALAVVEQGLLTYPEEPRLEELRDRLGARLTPASPPESGPPADPEATRMQPRKPAGPPAEEKKPKQPPPEVPVQWRRWLPAAALAVIFVVALAVVSVVARGRPRKGAPPAGARVVSLSAHPPGAAITVDGETCGISHCEPRLAPGPHRAEARLSGYQSAAADFTVGPSGADPIYLALTPAGTSVRIASDVENAAVMLDNAPAGKIQNGAFELGRVAPGTHTLTLQSGNTRTALSFEVAEGSAPWLRQPPAPGGLRTVVVAAMGPSARVWANWKGAQASLDGKLAGGVAEDGLALNGLADGSHELALVSGAGQHKLVFNAESAASLTAYIGSDQSLGSLRIETGEDDVTVYLNGQRQRRTTQRGRLVLSVAPRGYTVRVEKAGFQRPPDQTVEARSGEETRVAFRLIPAPRFAALQIRGTAGAEVVLDGRTVGTIGDDGSFSYPKLDPPGRHTLIVRKEGFKPRQYEMNFPAGAATQVDGALEALTGTLRIEANPGLPEIRLSLRRDGDTVDRPLGETTMQLPEGAYRITGTANGYQTGSATVRVAAGRTTTASLALRRIEAPKAAAKPSLSLADWEKTGGWTREGGTLIRRGGNVVAAPLAPAPGTYTFTITLQKGSRLEWLLNYQDDKNYIQYQLDKNNFSRVEVVNGRRGETVRTPHRVNRDDPILIQIDVTSEAILHRIQRQGQWQFLDEFRKAGSSLLQGPFAFRVPGRDQIALSDFRFVPR